MKPDTRGFQLRHLALHGPNREIASIPFGPGLNVVYGASDTGKSFIADALDFMLGGKPPLRDLPELVGYDRVLLGIETSDGEKFTLIRPVAGGTFRLYAGLLTSPPPPETEARDLSEIHSEKNPNNLSSFLLEKSGLAGKRVRKNRYNETNSLSFRHIARLLIVTETEITKQSSPLNDGNPTGDTPNFAAFKLLLTGLDDSALVTGKAKTPEDQSRDAQLELLDQLMDEHRGRLKELTRYPDQLSDQYEKLTATLSTHDGQLSLTEKEYRDSMDRRRKMRKDVEGWKDRRDEVLALLERFNLLDRHYKSDIARLQAIEEAGSLFEVLSKGSCPLCGAAPVNHGEKPDCEGNMSVIVAAARMEIAKIAVLQADLQTTVADLKKEAAQFAKHLPRHEDNLRKLSEDVELNLAPKLARLRSSYSDLANKRGEVREALSIRKSISDIEERRLKLENSEDEEKGTAGSEGDLPTSIADGFAKSVEAILKEWHFPEPDRVYFDSHPKKRDLVIASKARIARGKGLRAITHAAFTIGLLDYCRSNEVPHPGFVVLDSPLLAYRAPEGADDDLRGTDVDAQFYSFLRKWTSDRQAIIFENDPPAGVPAGPQVTLFSKNPKFGRYGFFPLREAVSQQQQSTTNGDPPQ